MSSPDSTTVSLCVVTNMQDQSLTLVVKLNYKLTYHGSNFWKWNTLYSTVGAIERPPRPPAPASALPFLFPGMKFIDVQ